MQYINTFDNADFNQSPYCKSHARFSYLMARNLNKEFRMPTDKTLFGVFGDDTTLRAFRIERFIFTLSGIAKDVNSTWGYAYVNIAGAGRKWVAIRTNEYIYESVDEYRRYNGLPINAAWLFSGNPATINQLANGRVGIHLYDDDMRAEFVSHGWVDNRLDYQLASIIISYDAFSGHVCAEVTKKDGYPYASAAQCMAENEVKVVTFEDEGQQEYEVEIEVIKTITTTIKCSSKESAVNAAKTAFEGKEIKVYVNHELEYSSY
jgi:uncharacterized protein (UPF0297 family)